MKHKEKRFATIVLYSIIIVTLLYLIYVMFGSFTGLTIYENITTEDLEVNQQYVQDDVLYIDEIEGTLQSLRLTGNYTGNGTFSIYLKDNKDIYLILENRISQGGLNVITGQVVGTDNVSSNNTEKIVENKTREIIDKINKTNVFENETIVNITKQINDSIKLPVENISQNISNISQVPIPKSNESLNISNTSNIEENITINVTEIVKNETILNITKIVNETINKTIIQNITQNFSNISEQIIPEINETLNISNISLIEENITEIIENKTLVNVTPTNITPEIIEIVKFENECLDTCLLPELNSTEYEIVIELNDITLNIGNITYVTKTSYELIENVSKEDAIFEVNATPVEINKPVLWNKKVNSSKIKEIDLPKESYNISVDQENKIKVKVKYERLSIKDYNKRKLGKDLRKKKGSVVSAQSMPLELDENVTLDLKNASGVVKLRYYTEGPSVQEKIVSKNKKLVTVSSDIPYKNVLTYTNIAESRREEIKLYWIKDTGREIFRDVQYLDTNNNGLIDKLQWIVPHLSEQRFEIIIEITKALRLDQNRNFISNIYSEVKHLDNTWSEPIYSGNYVRISFEQNLTEKNDITLYARNNQELDTYVEVYYFNTSEKVAQFPIINKEKYYKVYLDELEGSHHTFDLKIINNENNGAYLEFDHIIDPTTYSTVAQIYGESLGQNGDGSTVVFPLSGKTVVDNIYEHQQNSRINFTEDGIYKVSYGAKWNAEVTGDNERRIMRNWIRKNGNEKVIPSETACYLKEHEYAASFCSNSGVLLINVSEGDYIELLGDKLHGTTGATNASYDSWLYVQKVERDVSMRYDSQGGTEHSGNSFIEINLDQNITIGDDFSHGGNATYVNKAGWYKIYYTVNTDEVGNGDRVIIKTYVKKNSNEIITPSETFTYIRRENSDGDISHNSGYFLAYLNQNDYVELFATRELYDDDVSVQTIADQSWLLIERLVDNDILQVRQASGNQALNANTETVINLETEDIIGSSFTHSEDNNITFNNDGWYEISYALTYDDEEDDNRGLVNTWIRKNGNQIVIPSNSSSWTRGTSTSTNGGAARYTTISANFIYNASAKDYVELMVRATEEGHVEPNATWISIIPVLVSFPPEVTINYPTPYANISDLTPQINFTITDDKNSQLNYTIHIDGAKNGQRGNVTKEVPFLLNLTTLSQGTHTLIIEGINPQGKRQNSSEVTLTVDTLGPEVNITNVQNTSNISGNYFILGSAFDNSLEVDTVIFLYRKNDTANWEVECEDKGPPYRCALDTSALEELKTYMIRAYANDTLGNIGSNYILDNVTIDNTGPETNLTDPVNLTVITENTYLLRANSLDELLDVDTVNFLFRENETASWQFACSNKDEPYRCTWELYSLFDGNNYQLRAYANDTINNMGLNFTVYNISINRPIPIITFGEPTPKDKHVQFQNSVYINITSDKNLDTAVLEWDGTNETMEGSGMNWYLNKTNLVNATYWYIVHGNDSNNVWGISENRTVTIDTNSPSWSNNLTYPEYGVIHNQEQSYQFNVTWQDMSQIDKVWIEHNFNNTLKNYTVTQSVADVYFYYFENMSAGVYNWKMHANDTAGNYNSTNMFEYLINRQASQINLTINNTDNNLTTKRYNDVNLTVELIEGDYSQVEIYIDGNLEDSGYSILKNTTAFSSLGTFNITAVYPQSENYTKSTDTLFITTINTPPFTENVTITSSEPVSYSNASLTASWDFGDIENDPEVRNEIRWYNDTIEVVSLKNKTTIGSLNTTTFENWTIEVRTFDGYNWSEWIISDIMFIEDSPPHLRNVYLLPENISNNNNIYCIPEGGFDTENHNIQNITSWNYNGNPYALIYLPFEKNNNLTWARDYSGNDYSAQLGDAGTGETTEPTYTTGKIGGAYDFDGNDYMPIKDFYYSSSRSYTEVTVSAWIKTSSDGIILSYDRNLYWRLEVGGNADSGKLGFQVMTDSGQLDWSSGISVDDNNWHHVAGKFDNGEVYMYIDGLLVNHTTLGTNFGGNTNRYGCVAGNSESTTFNSDCTGNHFNGLIDEVKIYNLSISSAQIYQDYLAGLENHTTNIINANETNLGETWSCSVTPNDGYADGKTINSETITVTGNNPPTILNITYNQDEIPLAGQSKYLRYNLTLTDFNGVGELNDTSLKLTINSSNTYRNATCTAIPFNSTIRRYNCSLEIWYFDAPGPWTINTSISDIYGEKGFDDSNSFNYGLLTSVQLQNNKINLSTVLIKGAIINATNDPLILNNTGNDIFSTVKIRALDLLGTIQRNYFIPASNFTAGISDDFGQRLQNNSNITITGAILGRGNDETEEIYIWANLTQYVLPQNYNTSPLKEWTIYLE